MTVEELIEKLQELPLYHEVVDANHYPVMEVKERTTSTGVVVVVK